MNQNYSSKQLLKLYKKGELFDHNLNMDDLIEELDDSFNKIIKKKFSFDLEQVGEYYLTNNLSQKLIMRKLNDNLKRLYKDEQANRRVIISQVKTLLSENCPMWILKTDIDKFYDNIDRNWLLTKLQNDAMLSFHSIQLLKTLFNNPLLVNLKGIPRGMNISATLSEIYMRKFDRWIRRTQGVYYYARFVDDIIVFSNNKKVILAIKQNINKHLEKGLRKKEIKTDVFKGDNIIMSKPLEYLGYKFTTETKKTKKHLTVSIAAKKIKKMKSRITLALLDYIKINDFELLDKRMRFLTGNYTVKKNNERNDLKAGIYYNYLHVTDNSVFEDMNNYYRKALHSKSGNFGAKLSAKLNMTQRKRLSINSFKYGFKNKIYNSYTVEEMKRIKSCW